jgi:hypothetical protein
MEIRVEFQWSVSRVAVAEAGGQFRNLEKGERSPLETVTIGLLKREQTRRVQY